jgi:hypothetical protein
MLVFLYVIFYMDNVNEDEVIHLCYQSHTACCAAGHFSWGVGPSVHSALVPMPKAL